MSNPSSPNYKKTVGRLVTDRFDFQSHIEGSAFRHKADQIDLQPTLTIDGDVVTNVQEALSKINENLTIPIIPDATTSIKGIVKLSKDLGGTADLPQVIGIQGRPISSMLPTDGQLLTWDGTGNFWGPSDAPASFTAGGDLVGTSSSQQVIALTGAVFGGNTATNVKCDFLKWDYNVVAPAIYQEPQVGSSNGKSLAVLSQDATAATFSGGRLFLSSGIGGASGASGPVEIAVGKTHKLVQLTDLDASTSRRVLALCRNFSLTSTQMPAATGNHVIYIADTVTPPTYGNPVDGTILYSEGGVLKVKQPDGTQFAIEPGAGSISSTYLNKTTAFADTLSSDVTVDGSVTFSAPSTLSTDLSSKVEMSIGNVNSFINVQDNGKIQIGTNGSVRATASNTIRLSAASAIQATVDNSIVLNNTVNDWINFSSARTMSDVFHFAISGLHSVTASTTNGWLHSGGYSISTALGVVATLEIPIPREAQGANILSVSVTYQISTLRIPPTNGGIAVLRINDATGGTTLIGPSTPFDYNTTTAVQTKTCVINVGNSVIDKSTYRYYVLLSEENGIAPATFGGNFIYSFKANYTNITKHRF